ncbi:hypothetical protein ACIQ6R_35655 [Streptomyces sp. NPDC096048]|uniref:hypothetical protein n=1 Tax=Streptomyces sp. NPDC096048 TaxID=3366072 RepID=UPI0037FF391A
MVGGPWSPRPRPSGPIAIDGLERALAAVDLLEEALTLDLRRPQDCFGRVWSTAFRAHELARHGGDAGALGKDDDVEAP